MREVTFSKTADGKVNVVINKATVKGTELNLTQIKAAKKAYQWSPAVEQMYLNRVKQRLSDDGFQASEVNVVLAKYKSEIQSA